MPDTIARHGPSPNASLNSVKLDQHQLQPTATVGTADPSPQVAEQQSVLDPTTILLLALFLAIIMFAFWKVLLKVAIVAVLAAVFAGILIPVMWMSSPH